MFRDRVVSMEQTLEGGEKHLELLKAVCLEAFPDYPYREHALDHERDLFMMTLEASDGRRKSVGWTRMTLFDAERVPALASDPNGPLRAKVIGFLRERASRPEIVVTFRHLEDGWMEAPEPRPPRRRRRRGGGRGAGRPAEKVPPGPGAPRGGELPAQRQASAAVARPAPAPPGQRPAGASPAGQARPSGSRRRFRRRRRSRGGSPGPAGSPHTP
jgi:hypothetical protein